jgi:hypothetical protein
MSAVSTIKAARAAGISFAIVGNDLVLEAPAPPSPGIIEAISEHKPEILNLLRSSAIRWSAADWQALFDERAGILEHDGNLGRLDAEMIAFEDCVDHWLAMQLPLADRQGCCLHCRLPMPSKEQAAVVVTCADGDVGRLHFGCAATWKNLRRWDARTALRWLLEATKRGTP